MNGEAVPVLHQGDFLAAVLVHDIDEIGAFELKERQEILQIDVNLLAGVIDHAARPAQADFQPVPDPVEAFAPEGDAVGIGLQIAFVALGGEILDAAAEEFQQAAGFDGVIDRMVEILDPGIGLMHAAVEDVLDRRHDGASGKRAHEQGDQAAVHLDNGVSGPVDQFLKAGGEQHRIADALFIADQDGLVAEILALPAGQIVQIGDGIGTPGIEAPFVFLPPLFQPADADQGR